jgi:putative restriction endonuclease
MKYFWVNQGASYNEESSMGILFAPRWTIGKEGKKNAGERLDVWHWKSMLNLAVGDIVVSYVEGKIVSFGVITKRAIEDYNPISSKSNRWAEEVWIAKMEYTKLTTPVDVRKFAIHNGHLFTSPLPYSVNGNKGLTHYLVEISDALGLKILEEANINEAQVLKLSQQAITRSANPNSIEIDFQSLSETEREYIAKRRVTQGLFREALKKKFKEKCVLTGLETDFLIASHIKPWSISDNQERNDVNNGLLLAVPIDTLFDKRLISFNDDGSIIISKGLSDEAMQVFGINSSMRLRVQLTDENKAYLKTHRDNLK